MNRNLESASSFHTTTRYHWLEFENWCLKASGGEFQRLFENIMKKAKSNFVPIRPHGNIGDRKCDGYLNGEGVVFQVYSPDELKQGVLQKKINEDLNGAVEHWRDDLTEWVFVYNSRNDRLAPDIIRETLSGKEKQFPNIRISLWNLESLWQIFRSLTPQQRVEIFGESSTTEPEIMTTNIWSEVALQSALWDKSTKPELIGEFKQVSAKIINIFWLEWQAALVAFPDDLWRDEHLPIRTLEVLELLLANSSQGADLDKELTIAEVALLVITPFLREAILASSLVQAAKANPLSLFDNIPQTGFRSALDKIQQASPRLVRKAKLLENQERFVDKNAVMAWLLHQTLLQTPEVWFSISQGGYLSEEFIHDLDSAIKDEQRLIKEALLKERLIELSCCMSVGLERIDQDDRSNALHWKLTVGSYRDEQKIREKMIAYLLHLANLLAIDIRILSDVVVDHIGLSDPLTPEQVLETIANARWNQVNQGRTLAAICRHPAVDLALRRHIEESNLVLLQIQKNVEKHRDLEVLIDLPAQLIAEGIKADQEDGMTAYHTPHITFQLAHDEIRELLMGEQLYREPKLAIRELYQNALDACRYREARLRYLQQIEQYENLGQGWSGHIVFRQGRDMNGREYIECEDNGIGMGMRHLSQYFARAGRRFADSPEFIEEQAEWLRCEPPIRLYPNSQFGIGVLSYFMLADEIEVDTCRLNRKGQLEEKLRVCIPASSGLFRIQNGSRKDAGTRVRLYLNRDSISCIATLKALLWVADFETEIYEYEEYEVWQPGHLKRPKSKEQEYTATVHPDIWWASNGGDILSDGILTFSGERVKENQFTLINLKGPYRPKLTVDRKHILSANLGWIAEVLKQSWENLIDWVGLTYTWLWRFELAYPTLAKQLVNVLLERNGTLSYGKRRLPIREVGCFFPDREMQNMFDEWWEEHEGWSEEKCDEKLEELTDVLPSWLLPVRLTFWERYGLKVPGQFWEKLFRKRQTDTYSENDLVLLPGDAMATSKKLNGYPPWIKSHVSPIHVIRVSGKLEESVVQTLKRMQRFSSFGLKLPSVDFNLLEDLIVTKEDLAIFSTDLKPFPFGSSYQEPDDLVSISKIVQASVKLDKPIDFILGRLQRFTPLGLKLPKIKLDEANIQISEEDLYILSINLNGEDLSLLESEICAAHVVRAAAKLNKSVNDVWERLKELSFLNLKLPQAKPKVFRNLQADKKDLVLLSKNLDGLGPWLEGQITAGHIIRGSLRLSETIAKTLERFQKLAPLGLDVPQVAPEQLTNIQVASNDLVLLSQHLDGKAPLLEKQVSLMHLIQASAKLDETIVEIIGRFEQLILLDLEVPKINLKALGNLKITKSDLIALSKYMNGKAPWIKHEFSPGHIVRVSVKLNKPLEQVMRRLQKLEPLGFYLPKIDIELLNGLEVRQEDLIIFLKDLNDSQFSLFAEEEKMPEDEVDYIRIIYASAKMNKPIIEIFQHLQRYTCIGLKLPEMHLQLVDNLSVTEQDLIILSKYLTGKAPWLENEVSSEHMVKASKTLKKSVHEVTSRLRSFAPLLNLALPQADFIS